MLPERQADSNQTEGEVWPRKGEGRGEGVGRELKTHREY